MSFDELIVTLKFYRFHFITVRETKYLRGSNLPTCLNVYRR